MPTILIVTFPHWIFVNMEYGVLIDKYSRVEFWLATYYSDFPLRQIFKSLKLAENMGINCKVLGVQRSQNTKKYENKF